MLNNVTIGVGITGVLADRVDVTKLLSHVVLDNAGVLHVDDKRFPPETAELIRKYLNRRAAQLRKEGKL